MTVYRLYVTATSDVRSPSGVLENTVEDFVFTEAVSHVAEEKVLTGGFNFSVGVGFAVARGRASLFSVKVVKRETIALILQEWAKT